MTGLIKVVALATMLVAIYGCQSRVGDKPVVKAVATNDTAEVKLFLAEGGNPNFENQVGDPLLYIAAGPRGGLDVAILLLEAGANVDGQSRTGRSVLQNATSWCDADMVSLLLVSGVDVNMVGGNGKTALNSVCKAPASRREPVLELLKTAAADKG